MKIDEFIHTHDEDLSPFSGTLSRWCRVNQLEHREWEVELQYDEKEALL